MEENQTKTWEERTERRARESCEGSKTKCHTSFWQLLSLKRHSQTPPAVEVG